LYANGWTLSLTDQLEARRACEESLRLTEHGASDIVAANCMAMLGVLSMRAGDVAGALRMARDSIAGSDAVGDRPPISGTLHTAARALVGVAEPEVIATLGGAIYAGWYTFMLPRTPVADRLSEVDLDAARKALSPRGFDEAWEAGAAMSYEELIPFVLSALDRALLGRGGPIQVA
jgi:hypothetical protein